MKERIFQLMQSFDEGEISSVELDELNELLAEDEGKRAWIASSMLNLSLGELGTTQIDRSLATALQHADAGSVEKRKRRPGIDLWTKLTTWPGLAAVAVAAVLVMIEVTGRGFGQAESNADVLRLVRFSGDVHILRDGEHMTADADAEVRPGDVIDVSDESSAVLRFDREATTIELAERSRFQATILGDAKVLELQQGTAVFDVAEQSHAMLVQTPTATTEVLGTRFVTSAESLLTSVLVEQGSVLVSPIEQSEEVSGQLVDECERIVVVDGSSWSLNRLTPEQSAHVGLQTHSFPVESAPVSVSQEARVAPTTCHSRPPVFRSGDLGHASFATGVGESITQMTIAFFVHLDTGTEGLQTLLANSPHGANTPGVRLKVYRYEHGVRPYRVMKDGALYLTMGTGSRSVQATSREGVISEGAWHHVAVCFDTVSRRCRLYVDGVDVTERDRILKRIATGQEIHVGGMPGPLPHSANGRFADIRVYQRCLKTDEIRYLAQDLSLVKEYDVVDESVQ